MNKPCAICTHPNHATLHARLAAAEPLAGMSQDTGLPIAALWRCRLNHIEDPTHHYDVLVASARKARLLNKPDQKPIVSIIDHPSQIPITKSTENQRALFKQGLTEALQIMDQRIRAALSKALESIPGALPAALQALESAYA